MYLFNSLDLLYSHWVSVDYTDSFSRLIFIPVSLHWSKKKHTHELYVIIMEITRCTVLFLNGKN